MLLRVCVMWLGMGVDAGVCSYAEWWGMLMCVGAGAYYVAWDDCQCRFGMQ